MKRGSTLYSDLKYAKEFVYDKCGLVLTNLTLNSKSAEYGACTFQLGEQKIEHRTSKITPKKTGQFVTIWKRNKNGKTEPFDFNDDIDFVIITVKSEGRFGQFIFSKTVLSDHGIFTRNGKEGKRGIRVYPPWDIVNNKQAVKTQSWQTKYFLTINNDDSTNLDFLKKMVTSNSK